ncbi:EAL domain-containing protein [Escherichia coli]|nr:EAL domain-containing protein [Escherichia coli]
MSEVLYLSNDMLLEIRLPESAIIAGEEHLSLCLLEGMKAEPLIRFHSGQITGYEFLSQLSAGICSETFFRQQSACSLAELFLLQLRISSGLTTKKRFLNLPVRVLVRRSLCEVICRNNLNGIVVEIQDPEHLTDLCSEELDSLCQNLNHFLFAGAEVYADDVSPLLMKTLSGGGLPLSGMKVSRQQFLSQIGNFTFSHSLRHPPIDPATSLVAEGIETPEQCMLAIMLGFTHGQGWLWPPNVWRFVLELSS